LPTPDAAARVGYLGPRGTFSEEALRRSADLDSVEGVPLASIHDAVMAVQNGIVRWSIVPIENSIEGPVTVTLDALVVEATDTRIVAEVILPVHQCLIALGPVALDDITTVVSHPQATGQCAEFLRAELPHAAVRAANSTASAVRAVAEGTDRRAAALGPALAADIYGGVILRDSVEDRRDNETRFVWLGRGDEDSPPVRPQERHHPPAHKTSIVFWGTGDGQPGWLVDCLNEFARRDVNLSKIESRPQRSRLGRYIFFVDVDGAQSSRVVADALAGLRVHSTDVRILGSYPAA
jgi:prephenate dehydratase